MTYPYWWAAALLLLPATAIAQAPVTLRAGEPAPYAGVLVTTADAALVPRLTTALRQCRSDLGAARARACPECLPCPTPRPVRVEVVRVPWWPVVVAGAVGIVAGAYVGWRVTR